MVLKRLAPQFSKKPSPKLSQIKQMHPPSMLFKKDTTKYHPCNKYILIHNEKKEKILEIKHKVKIKSPNMMKESKRFRKFFESNLNRLVNKCYF